MREGGQRENVVNAEKWSTENWSTGKKRKKCLVFAYNKKFLI
jgi:hypothetical protein